MKENSLENLTIMNSRPNFDMSEMDASANEPKIEFHELKFEDLESRIMNSIQEKIDSGELPLDEEEKKSDDPYKLFRCFFLNYSTKSSCISHSDLTDAVPSIVVVRKKTGNMYNYALEYLLNLDKNFRPINR